MEIQKSNITSLSSGTLVRQSEAIRPTVKTGQDERRSQGSIGTSSLAAIAISPDDREAAIKALDAKRNGFSRENAASSYVATVDGRARRALDAYLTQQNLPYEENDSTLSAMLGVDYFA